MKTERSTVLFEEALRLIPGGVNSPVRACKSVNCPPLFIQRAKGAHVFDEDGNAYIDYVGSWGPMILGHGHPAVLAALSETLASGTSFGAPTEKEITLARMVVDAVPALEMVRMVNSGTEATMSAVRLARGVTGRSVIVKFDGCYHGHADTLLVDAGSGVATFNIPGSPGIPSDITKHTLSVPYNDLAAIDRIMDAYPGQVAGIIVEPVGGNMGMVPPAPGFLQGLRDRCDTSGALLIFDEVMTGFRLAYGGAQALFGIDPDLSCFGKVIGGGLPVGAYGGRQRYMRHIAPDGPVYQAGTLSGNPLAMAAGIATLTQLQQPGTYEKLDALSGMLVDGLNAAIADTGIPATADRVGSMIGLFFTKTPVTSFAEAKAADLDMFTRYYQGMRNAGIYLAPSQFEAGFVSLAHTEADIRKTVEAAASVFRTLVP